VDNFTKTVDNLSHIVDKYVYNYATIYLCLTYYALTVGVCLKYPIKPQTQYLPVLNVRIRCLRNKPHLRNSPMDFLSLYIYFIYAMIGISGLLIILAIYECFSPGNKWIFWVSSAMGLAWLWGYILY